MYKCRTVRISTAPEGRGEAEENARSPARSRARFAAPPPAPTQGHGTR